MKAGYCVEQRRLATHGYSFCKFRPEISRSYKHAAESLIKTANKFSPFLIFWKCTYFNSAYLERGIAQEANPNREYPLNMLIFYEIGLFSPNTLIFNYALIFNKHILLIFII
jgi:hypothetical protein